MVVILILLLAGVVLLALETILPGLVAGGLGLLCLAGAVLFAYEDYGMTGGNAALALVTALLTAGAFLWFRYFPHSRWGRRFVSERAIGGAPAAPPELLHRTGIALTNLRPSGTAGIDGRRIDVVTEGAMVAPGTPVKVIAIEGIRVVVRPLEATARATDFAPNPPHL